MWGGESTISATFTPLTINDIDVSELTFYNTLCSAYTLEVDTISPDDPLLIIGLNEYIYYCSPDSLGKISSGLKLKMKKIKLRKSA